MVCAHSQITILRIRLCRLLYIVSTQHFERSLEILEKTEIKKILKFYKSIYPNSKLSELNIETVNSWYLMFEDYSYEQVQRAIIKFSKSNKYIPNLAEIISNIEVPEYTIELIEPYTVIVSLKMKNMETFHLDFSILRKLRKISKNLKNAVTTRSQSRSYMKNMLEKEMLEFLHTGEKQKQDWK